MEYVTITYQTLMEAVHRAVEETGEYRVTFSGDFGQDEERGEVGMGNHKYSILVYPNGTAILTIGDNGTVQDYFPS